MCVGHRNGAQREACPSGSHRPDQCWIVGYTATRAIRKNSQFKDTPIVAMTANAIKVTAGNIGAKASDTAEEVQTLTRGTHLAKGLQKVAASIADYDFDVALEHMKGIRQ